MPVRAPLHLNWRGTERARRQMYVIVAAVASVIQLGIALLDVVSTTGHALPEAWVGAVICGGAAALLHFTRLPWQVIDYGVLAAASLSVGGQLLDAALSPTPPPARLLFTGVFLFVAGFSILNTLWAVVYAAVLFTGFAGVMVARGGDLTLLGELGLAGVLIAHLSIYGRQLSLERAELEVATRLARTDSLTGLDNRRAAVERLTTAFERGAPMAAMLIDVDHFKDVNDRLGHDVGDDVLRRVGQVLQREVGAQGHVARWGGEEFLVTLTAVGPAPVGQVAERLRAAVGAAPPPGLPPVTVSIGVVRPEEAATVHAVLKLADARMYAAKARGRNRVEPGHPDTDPRRDGAGTAGSGRPAAAAPHPRHH